MGEVVTRDELIEISRAIQSTGAVVVFTNGCFDILHRGHTDYLERAKSLGDILVVGVNTDRSVRVLKGETRPIVPEEDRAHVLASLASVDYVCLFDEDTPLELIAAIVPDVLCKGAGYSVDNIVGADLVTEGGGTVVALEPLEGRSTRSIVERILEEGKGR